MFLLTICQVIKHNKAQLSKIIKSGGFHGAFFGKLAGPSMKVVVPLAKDVLAPLASVASVQLFKKYTWPRSSEIRKKGITLVIINEDMDQIKRIIKSPENSNLLIDAISETVKTK